jgi:hypothetical protein
VIAHALKESKATCKHAVLYFNLLAYSELWTHLRPDETTLVFLCAQAFDDAGREHAWFISIAHNMTYSYRRSDRTPALDCQVNGNENVTWEKRRLHRFDTAGVATLL